MGFNFKKALKSVGYGSPALAGYNAFRRGTSGSSNPGPNVPWYAGSGIPTQSSVSQIPGTFSSLTQNNPLATSVGKYAAPYLGLLGNKGPFSEFKQQGYGDLSGGQEIQDLESYTDPGFWQDLVFSAGEGAVTRGKEQTLDRLRGAAKRGGLGAAGERAAEARATYGALGALGDLASTAALAGGERAQNATLQLLQLKTAFRDKELAKMLQELGIEEAVLDKIIQPTLGYKSESGLISKQQGAAAAGALGQGVGSLAGLLALL